MKKYEFQEQIPLDGYKFTVIDSNNAVMTSELTAESVKILTRNRLLIELGELVYNNIEFEIISELGGYVNRPDTKAVSDIHVRSVKIKKSLKEIYELNLKIKELENKVSK